MAHSRKRKRLSPAETELMQHLWRLERATVTELRREVNAGRPDPVSRNTVLVQLQRLEAKGWVRHEEAGRSHLYESTVPAEEGIAEITRDFRNKVFGGSALALVRCLVSGGGLTREEIAELKKLIHEEEKGKKS